MDVDGTGTEFAVREAMGRCRGHFHIGVQKTKAGRGGEINRQADGQTHRQVIRLS